MSTKNHLTHPILLTPGPVSISEKVLMALAQPMIFHRSADFKALFTRVRSKLRIIFGAPDNYEILLFSGSGTLAIEATLSSLFSADDQVLILSNGDFGERLHHILEAHGIGCYCLEQPWATAFDIENVSRLLENPAITGVAIVALETSTGMVNAIHEIGKKCRATGRIFFVDAVSALGAEDLDVTRDNIDLCVSVSNKGLEGPPGLSFVCANPAILRRRTSQPRSFYLDLFRYLDFSKDEQTPTTPAVSIIVALEKALDLLIDEGVFERRKRYYKHSQLLRTAVESIGLEVLIASNDECATAITTLCFPHNINTQNLHLYLFERGVTVWHPHNLESRLGCNAIQVSVMGIVSEMDINYFLDILNEYISHIYKE